MSSLNSIKAVEFQDYVRDFHDQLLSLALFGFDSRNRITILDDIKREYVLPELVTQDLVRRGGLEGFTPLQDAMEFDQRVLRVEDARVDLKIYPNSFEKDYRAMYREKGDNSYDLPFAGFIIQKILQKVATEQELSLFRADKAGTAAQTDKLVALFDGFATIIADDQAEVTPVITPAATGAITATNGVAALESVYQTLGSQYFGMRVDVYMNHSTRIKVVQDYRERYGKYTTEADGSIRLEIGNAVIHSVHGMPDNAILITPRENMFYGCDREADSQLINFENEDRSIKMWMDFKMGVNYGIFHDEIIAINDQF